LNRIGPWILTQVYHKPLDIWYLADNVREILSAPAEILSPQAKFSPQSGSSLCPQGQK
jgi:hypothetical protein